MASAWNRAMVYLGFTEGDERYEDDDYEPEPRGTGTTGMPRREPVSHVAEDDLDDHRAPVTQLPARGRQVPMAHVVGDLEVAGVNRITTIHPRTYNEAKNIGENFREGTPVIMNLTDLDDADAKRLVDFAAGLVFGLQGTIERVTAKVFLLSPAHVEVTSDDGDTVKAHKTLFNQS